MLIIGICGASGSGKSTLADELQKSLGDKCFILKQDSYYKDFPNLTFEERAALNFDHPDIFDHESLYQDVCALQEGKAITEKVYDFTLHRRRDSQNIIEPCDILIIEGIHAFYDAKLFEKMFLKLYIKVEEDICLLRRIERDIVDRGRSIESIGRQYLATVKPMYNQFIKSYVDIADVIIARGGKNCCMVDILTGYVLNKLNNDK
ncbi:MAG: uridine kinase [Eubacteriales bacterium]|nr:uridine kinase [Eubacteriales bacterium]